MATYRVQRIYSKFDDFNDKSARFQHKHPYLTNGPLGKSYERALKEQLAGKEGKASKDYLKKSVIVGAGASGVLGGIIGSGVRKNKKGAAVGALVGTGLGAIDGYASSKLSSYLQRKKVGDEIYKKERWLDNMKVVDGEMTEAEFNKKWKSKK